MSFVHLQTSTGCRLDQVHRNPCVGHIPTHTPDCVTYRTVVSLKASANHELKSVLATLLTSQAVPHLHSTTYFWIPLVEVWPCNDVLLKPILTGYYKGRNYWNKMKTVVPMLCFNTLTTLSNIVMMSVNRWGFNDSIYCQHKCCQQVFLIMYF